VLLVVAGLLISVPIVVWGSTLILGWIERYPSLLYAGGAVLAWTAAKMIAAEPLFEAVLAGRPLAGNLIYIAAIGGVLAAAWLRNRRPKARKETA
jgi:predicted tellurium resistance membrane protein TerC